MTESERLAQLRAKLKARRQERHDHTDEVLQPPVDDRDDDSPSELVPHGLRVAAAWSWRIIVIVALAAIVVMMLVKVSEVVIAVFTAMLLTAALLPLHQRLVKHHWPAWLSAITCVLALVALVGGLLTLVGAQIHSQWSELTTQAVNGFEDLLAWLSSGPLHLGSDQLDAIIAWMRDLVSQQQGEIGGIVTEAGLGVGKFLAGLVMALFALFFFLKDGDRFANGAKRMLPRGARKMVWPALHRGWGSMTAYVRAVVVVAAVDGVGGGLGALLLGSDLWVAIMSLTFVCAFIPMIGAAIAGVIGVAVVLATLGWVKALIMAAIFFIVWETEVHVLQPLLLSRAVDIHPLVVLLGIAVGMLVGGIPGALFAIPLVALIHGVLLEVTGQPDDADAERSVGADAVAVTAGDTPAEGVATDVVSTSDATGGPASEAPQE